MTAAERPLAIPAYLAVAALIVAAHFGTAFNVLMVLAASFPVLFFFATDARHRDGATVSISVTLLGILWIGIPLAHAVLLRDLPTTARRCWSTSWSGPSSPTPPPTRPGGCSAATRSPPTSRRTRRSRGWSAAS